MRLRPDISRPIVDEASEILGRDLAAHYRADAPDPFATNRDVQVGVFLANHLYLMTLEAADVRAALSLGHSLGEYNHLVHIGALDFVAALRLVEARGQAYDAGPSGAMAAVFPLELDELRGVVERARAHGLLDIATFNAPTQHVLAGERRAVDAALAIVEEDTYAQAILIESRIPMRVALCTGRGRLAAGPGGSFLAHPVPALHPERPRLSGPAARAGRLCGPVVPARVPTGAVEPRD